MLCHQIINAPVDTCLALHGKAAPPYLFAQLIPPTTANHGASYALAPCLGWNILIFVDGPRQDERS